ncbi:MAG: RlmE family RNA methyltransferase [Gammaproteobacteria bacterium]|nr:RlmE family RNA methyltransferase [Gammaproteobacteria bacterium]
MGSSKRWKHEHNRDVYVRKARSDGYRSRAAYKLLELDRSDKLMRPGDTVVDLGASPGGWSQVAAEKTGPGGFVLGTDLLPMDPLEGVRFVLGDFTEQAVLDEILAELGNRPVDLVISDMAPNITGIRTTDQARSALLVELACDFAVKVLKPGGRFVVKVFQGESSESCVRETARQFASLRRRKPDASRGKSREFYVVASGFGL